MSATRMDRGRGGRIEVDVSISQMPETYAEAEADGLGFG